MSNCVDFFTAISEKEIKKQKTMKNYKGIENDDSDNDVSFLIQFVDNTSVYTTILENIGIVKWQDKNTLSISISSRKKDLLIKIVKRLDGFMNMKQVNLVYDKIPMNI